MEFPDFSRVKDRGSKKWSMAMMLPEHVQAIKELIEEDKKSPKPILDAYDYEMLNEELAIALRTDSIVRLRFWKDGWIKEHVGIVEDVDMVSRRIRVNKEGVPVSLKMEGLFSIVVIYQA